MKKRFGWFECRSLGSVGNSAVLIWNCHLEVLRDPLDASRCFHIFYTVTTISLILTNLIARISCCPVVQADLQSSSAPSVPLRNSKFKFFLRNKFYFFLTLSKNFTSGEMLRIRFNVRIQRKIVFPNWRISLNSASNRTAGKTSKINSMRSHWIGKEFFPIRTFFSSILRFVSCEKPLR